MALLYLGHRTTDLGWFLSPAFFIQRPPIKVLGVVSILMRKLNLFETFGIASNFFLFVGWVKRVGRQHFWRQWPENCVGIPSNGKKSRWILMQKMECLLPKCRLKLCQVTGESTFKSLQLFFFAFGVEHLNRFQRFSMYSFDLSPSRQNALTCNSCKGFRFLDFFGLIGARQYLLFGTVTRLGAVSNIWCYFDPLRYTRWKHLPEHSDCNRMWAMLDCFRGRLSGLRTQCWTKKTRPSLSGYGFISERETWCITCSLGNLSNDV